MSTHHISASGTRGLTIGLNDPAATGATIMAKQGDSVAFQGNSFDRVVYLIPSNAKVVRIRVPSTKTDDETGEETTVWSEYLQVVVENFDEEGKRMLGGQSVHVRAEILERAEGEYAATPHTTLFVRRTLDEGYWETKAAKDGTVTDEGTVVDLIGPYQAS